MARVGGDRDVATNTCSAETIVDGQIGYDFQPGSALEGLSLYVQGQNLNEEPLVTANPGAARSSTTSAMAGGSWRGSPIACERRLPAGADWTHALPSLRRAHRHDTPGFGDFLGEPRDRAGKAFLDRGCGLPAEQFAGASDVGAAAGRVVLG